MAVAQAPTRPVQPQHPGLQPGVMGMYIFLTSEVMFFGSLFATYFYLFGSHPFGWPPPGTVPVDWFPLPFINTFVLISSGVTCHFGLEAIRHEGSLGKAGAVGAIILVAFAAVELGTGLYVLVVEGSYFDGGLGLLGGLVAFACLPAMFGLKPFTGRRVFLTLWIATILLGAAFEAGQVYEFINAHISFSGLNQFGTAFFTMTGFHGGHVAGGLILLLLVLGRGLKGQFTAQHHVGPAAITLYWHFVDLVWVFLFGILYLAVTAV